MRAHIGVWSQRGALGKVAQMRGVRQRAQDRKPCKYCGELFGRCGLKLHESKCQHTGLRDISRDPCHCGAEKPVGARACWRHTERDVELRALDVLISWGLGDHRVTEAERERAIGVANGAFDAGTELIFSALRKATEELNHD